LKLSIKEHLHLSGIASGSAMEWVNDRFFVFGDDSPNFVVYTHNWLPLETIDLPEQDTAVVRIPKAVKHDIESAFAVQSDDIYTLYALGSGSVPEFRDKVFQINYNTLTGEIEVQMINANAYYDKLRTMLPAGNELNIEGAAICNNRLMLAQRGHLKQENYLLQMHFNKENTYSAQTDVSISAPIPLPEGLKGAGISGLFYESEENRLWFCGAIEATRSTYDDGEIRGSFIGYFTSADTANPEIGAWAMIDLAEDKEPVKIESIVIMNKMDDRYLFGAVADDDLGGTAAFLLELEL
jgi:hypothetical protein